MTVQAVVVGAGPAGLIAAETLAASGCEVTVYDHARSAGRKFLLAGRGGLNITHSEPLDVFAERYVDADWIRPMLDAFTPDDLRKWCDGLGEPTFVGSSGRVFPESFRATPLLRAWLRRLDDLGVRFEMRHRWLGWGSDGEHRFEHGAAVVDVPADVTVLALGGASWPRVGSDGGWVAAFERAGMAVVPLQPSNAGVRVLWTDHFRERFEGVPIKNVAVAAGDAPAVRGDVVVTRTGLEGGPIYAVNRGVRDGGVLSIDLHPDQTEDQLAARLVRRRPKDTVSNWLRRATGLSAAHVALMREAGDDMPAGAADVAARIKHLPLDVAGLAPIDRAISTAGGVSRDELDEDLMLHKRPGTFVAGEMIDWDAPTGGYLLQASFSTGVRAARGALSRIAR